jgi:hypothetical protein
MKKAIFLFILYFFTSCKKEDADIRICVNKCSATTPWKVESLDLGLPCFSTKEECLNWADAHGYNGYSCVKCD